MSAVEATTCTCVTFDPADTGTRQCPEHFHLWRGAVRLASVGSIVRGSFPLDPSIPPAVLENARERGAQLDRLFAAYCLGTLRVIPAGTRQDAIALFEKARQWFDKQNFKTVEVQVLLGCDDYGGVLDFRFDGVPVDLKGTSKIEHSHRMQVAAYAALDSSITGNVLHVMERIKEARLVELVTEDFDDWFILLEHWRMLKRRTNAKP